MNPRTRVPSWIIAAILAATFSTAAQAQPPVHVWSRALGGFYPDVGRALAIDGSGNIFVAGTFGGAADFGDGNPIFSSLNTQDGFVAKYDGNATLQWVRGFGASGLDYALSVAVNGSGAVFVTGYFYNTVDFGNGGLTSAGGADVFVAKYDAAGAPVWSRRFGSALDDAGYGIAVDPSGNVLLTGSFQGSIDFGGGPLSAAGTGTDIYLAKLDASGGHVWSKKFGGATNGDAGNGVAVDGSGNVFVTGVCRDPLDFGGGTLTGAGGNDAFLVKFNASGAHQWSKRFGGTGGELGQAVAVDGAGDVAITGTFPNAVDFGGGPLTSVGALDVFLAKYDAAGAHLWSKRFGSTSQEEALGLAMDPAGGVALTGYFSDDSANFGGDLLGPAGGGDAYIARYAPSGTHAWSKGLGAFSGDVGRAVAIAADGDVIATGEFRYNVDFGGGPLSSNGGSQDFYLVRYESPMTSGVDPLAGRADISLSAFPNPARSGVTVRFAMPSAGHVRASVCDVRGRRVATLLDEQRPAGENSVRWDRTDMHNVPAAPGLYFVTIERAGVVRTARLAIVR